MMTPFDKLAPLWVEKLAADLGITRVQAAGIVGNLGFESIGFTKLREIGQPEGKGGYGAGQWTADRRVSFLSYCAQHGEDWHSDEANYGYLLHELRGEDPEHDYRHTVAALKRVDTVEKAVFSFGQTYERPGGTTPGNLPGFEGRLMYAKRALLGHPAVPPAPIAPVADDPVVALQKQVQQSLAEAGYYKGEIDGDPGPRTYQAMNDYRAARGV